MSIGVLHGQNGGKGAALTVTAPGGSTVTVSKDGKSKTKVAGSDGIVVFKGLQSGTWTLTSTDGSQTASKTVEIVADYATEISYTVIPEFTYTGEYEIVNDADEPITTSQDNWKIRLLTSGTLKFNNLRGAQNGVDVFLVGGGGGGGAANGNAYHGGSGGGGGHVSTQKNVSITDGTSYSIVIGAGGSAASASNGGSGGETKAFGYSASGGSGGRTGIANEGGSGGSGGGGGSRYSTGGVGGSDGSAGSTASGSEECGIGGSGSGITTREFGDTKGRLYSGGGGGGSGYSISALSSGGTGGGGAGGSSTTNPTNGTANTGGGGGGSGCSSDNASGAAGGSGIVIIRNKR